MSRTALACLIVFAVAAPAWASPTKEEAAADKKWLVETWTKHEKAFGAGKYLVGPSGIGGGSQLYIYFGGDSILLQKLAEVEAIDADWKAIVERLDAIKTRYGTDDPRSVALRIARAEEGLPLEAKPVAKGWTTNRDPRTARFQDRNVKEKEESKKRAIKKELDDLTKEGAFTIPDDKLEAAIKAFADLISKESFGQMKGGHMYQGVYSPKAVVAAIEQLLGVTREAAEPSVKADRKVSEAHEGLKTGVPTLAGQRKTIADKLVADVDAHLKNNAWVHYSMVQKELALAARVNPTDEALKARAANFAEEAKKHRADNAAEIDKKEWPKHLPTFDGPGKAEELAARGLAHLKAGREVHFRMPSLDPKVYFNGNFHWVAVNEPWEVVKEVLGKPTIWGLKCYVVVTDEEMEKDGVAGVYLFRFHPAEHAERGTAWANAYGMNDTASSPHYFVRLANRPK